jgi:hypothetical protein
MVDLDGIEKDRAQELNKEPVIDRVMWRVCIMLELGPQCRSHNSSGDPKRVLDGMGSMFEEDTVGRCQRWYCLEQGAHVSSGMMKSLGCLAGCFEVQEMDPSAQVQVGKREMGCRS